MWEITPELEEKNDSYSLFYFCTDGRICSKIKVTDIKIQVINKGPVLNLT